MDLASTYNVVWETNQKKQPFSASFGRFRLQMFNIVGLILTVECSDGNIMIRTLENMKTHFIVVNCYNIVKIVAKRDCVKTKEDNLYDYVRHVVTVTYTLSDGTSFDIVINRDGFMSIESGINVMLELYGTDKSLTYSFNVDKKMTMIDNDKRFAIMSKCRGVVFAPPKNYYCQLSKPVLCVGLNKRMKPGDVFVDLKNQQMKFNSCGITATCSAKGKNLTCNAKDNDTNIVINFSIPFGMNPYEGPFMDVRLFDNKGIGNTVPALGYITTLTNLIMSKFTTLQVQTESFSC